MDHTAIAVPSIRDTATVYERLTGTRCSLVETLEEQGVRVAFIGNLELLEPLGEDTPVGRFLARRGPGLHHIAYRTPNIEEELARLVAHGLPPIDPAPRPGAGGHLVAFLHPRTAGGVLIELVQRAADGLTHE